MKLNPDFILQEMGGEAVLVPTGEAAKRFRGIVRLNETAAFIVERLRDDTDAEALVDALAAEYEGTREQFARSVELTLTQLREIGALIEGKENA